MEEKYLSPFGWHRGLSLRVLSVLCGLCLLGPAQAAKTRPELIFELKAALLAHDRAAFARCFYLGGAEERTRVEMGRILDQIYAWPTHDIFSTDRKDRGPARVMVDGRPYTFNGDWQFQVHIFLSKKTKTGYVFPAGMVSGRAFVLALVPAGQAPRPAPSPSPAP